MNWSMTNEQLAVAFLMRFPSATAVDVAELGALLDVAEERGAARVEWAEDEITTSGDLRALIAISRSETGAAAV